MEKMDSAGTLAWIPTRVVDAPAVAEAAWLAARCRRDNPDFGFAAVFGAA